MNHGWIGIRTFIPGKDTCSVCGKFESEHRAMKPHIKLAPQFVIPEPYRAWCFLCGVGFLTIEDITKHNANSVNEHQRANADQSNQGR